MLVATWNVEWAARTHRASIAERLAFLGADILAVTEGVTSVLPTAGFIAIGGTDWGIPVSDPERRKVLLWSRHPLADITIHEESDLPLGRLVAATCHTPDGPVRVIAVCIPWAFAHVKSGRRDAAPWQEHLYFLQGLRLLLRQQSPSMPLILLGDFNQRIPRTRAPRLVSDTLEDVLRPLELLTAGDIPGLGSGTVDHIAVTSGLHATKVYGIARVNEQGTQLSDHDLVAAHLTFHE